MRPTASWSTCQARGRGFEKELRALDFQPWRVALRTEGLVEYTPEIEHYPMQDLATNELYVSCVSRKKPG